MAGRTLLGRLMGRPAAEPPGAPAPSIVPAPPPTSRIAWQLGTVTAIRDETPTVRSFTLGLGGWDGHRPGQHVDLRLTAEDGYSVERSYSIASEPERGGEIDVTVGQIPRGGGSPLP